MNISILHKGRSVNKLHGPRWKSAGSDIHVKQRAQQKKESNNSD